MKVAVLHGEVMEGAGEDEQDVFVQAAAVSQSLCDLGYETVTLPLSLNIADAMANLRRLQPDFVFNLVEAIEGRGNMIHFSPTMLDAMNIPYTGAQTEAMFLTSSKIAAKKILKTHGIATPDWLSSDGLWPTGLAGARYIVKSAWEHASIGLDDDFVFSAGDATLLRQRIAALQKRLGGACFAEAFIEGRELNVALLAGNQGVELLTTAEILFTEYPPDKLHVLCYRSKWVEDSFEYENTPRTFDFPEDDASLLKHVQDTAGRCWDIFNLRGYARVDFRVDNTGKPWVLEVNANPCLSPDGGFIAAAKQSGIDYNGVIERIVKDIPIISRDG